MILLPQSAHGLRAYWSLAHELGHLVRHVGPRGELLNSKDEVQADQWAACALIPLARIQAYQNASPDAMIAALSAHYEDIPLIDCESRRLAGRIARIRLRALEEAS